MSKCIGEYGYAAYTSPATYPGMISGVNASKNFKSLEALIFNNLHDQFYGNKILWSSVPQNLLPKNQGDANNQLDSDTYNLLKSYFDVITQTESSCYQRPNDKKGDDNPALGISCIWLTIFRSVFFWTPPPTRPDGAKTPCCTVAQGGTETSCDTSTTFCDWIDLLAPPPNVDNCSKALGRGSCKWPPPPGTDAFGNVCNIPYVKYDNVWYWSLFINLGKPLLGNKLTGVGFTVMWSTTTNTPDGEGFKFVDGQTRYCNNHSKSTESATNLVGFQRESAGYGFGEGNYCCDDGDGGVDSCEYEDTQILPHCALFVRNLAPPGLGNVKPDATITYQVPLQTKGGAGDHHPNGKGNGGCDHDCHTASNISNALIIGLAVGIGVPILLVIIIKIYRHRMQSA